MSIDIESIKFINDLKQKIITDLGSEKALSNSIDKVFVTTSNSLIEPNVKKQRSKLHNIITEYFFQAIIEYSLPINREVFERLAVASFANLLEIASLNNKKLNIDDIYYKLKQFIDLYILSNCNPFLMTVCTEKSVTDETEEAPHPF